MTTLNTQRVFPRGGTETASGSAIVFAGRIGPILLLILLPILVQLPALAYGFDPDPALQTASLALGGHPGIIPGLPWADPNAGWTTQALGGLAAHMWLSGQVPWWNPYSGAGLPLAAEMQPSALFLPFVLLLALPKGVLLLKLMLQATAGLASYALLRKLQLVSLTATMGAVLFELNGTFAWFADAPMLSVAFIPLFLLGLERARDAALVGRRTGWRLTALALAFSLTAGFPESAYIDGLFAIAWAAFRLASLPGPFRGGYAMRVAAGGLVGVALAAPVLVPFAELLPRAYLGARDAIRPGDFGMPTAGLAILPFPYLFGPLAAFTSSTPRLLYLTIFGSGYAGTSLCTAAACGLAGSRERGLRLLLGGWIAVAFGKSLAVPGLNAAMNFLPGMPVVLFARYSPASWQMAAAILAAFALDDRMREGARPRRALFAGILTMIAALATLPPAWTIVELLRARVPHYVVYLWGSLLWGGAMLGLTALAFGLRARRGPILAALLLGFDAAALLLFPLLSAPRGAQVDWQAVRFLRHHLGLQRFVTLGPIQPNYGALFRIASVNHIYLPVPAAWVNWVHAHLDPHADAVRFTIPPGAPGSAILLAHLAGFRDLGVRYVVAGAGESPLQHSISSPVRIAAARPITLRAGSVLSGAIPAGGLPVGTISVVAVQIGTFFGAASGPLRVEICTGPVCATGVATLAGAADNALLAIALAAPLRVSGSTGVHYTFSHPSGAPVAIYAGRAPGWSPDRSLDPVPVFTLRFTEAGQTPSAAYQDSRISIWRLSGAAPFFEVRGGPCQLQPRSRRQVIANCRAPAMLIRREMLFPGWHAMINGRTAALRRADGLFQATTLPSGKSLLRFSYDPPRIDFAWAVCAAAALLLGVGIFPKRRS